MTLTLYAHPFSSYCQKVLIALYENDTPFVWRRVDEPGVLDDLSRLWPLKRFPVLIDGERVLIEASVIVEYLDIHHRGPVRMLPDAPETALEVRFMDRVFDNHVQTPMQRIVADGVRPAEARDAIGVAAARASLDTAYAWLEARMAGREWAAGAAFGLADCAAAPALFYADWAHPIGAAFPTLRAYRHRLNTRPSFARAIEEARPYRALFPLGAPDRD